MLRYFTAGESCTAKPWLLPLSSGLPAGAQELTRLFSTGNFGAGSRATAAVGA